MDEEKIIIEIDEEDFNSETIEEFEQDITKDETIEYITVDAPEEIIVEVDEAFPSYSNNTNSGYYAPLQHEHDIGEVERLSETLHNIASAKNVYALSGGFAEFRRWKDYKTYSGEESRVGYFVSIANNEGDIVICNKEYPDVYGVTVLQSGFCGYQNEEYDYLDPATPNKGNLWQYAKVCLIGDVRVRIHDTDIGRINVGDYVIPDTEGYAILSMSGVGYHVSSINNTTVSNAYGDEKMAQFVTISLVPQSDSISRIAEQLNNTQGSIEDIVVNMGDLTGALEDVNIKIDNNADGMNQIIGDLQESMDGMSIRFDDVEEIAKEAQINTAIAIDKVNLTYNEAVKKADEAKDTATQALTTIDEKLDKTITEQGTQIASIQKTADAIQQLVARVDRYSIGKHPPTYGLTKEEADIVMEDGYVYVPTVEHSEPYKDYGCDLLVFDDEDSRCRSYAWTDAFGWQFYNYVYTNTDAAPNGLLEIDDLWYCWQSGLEPYEAGTLYCWNGTEWVAVAIVNDSARSIGFLRQTADELTSTYTDINENLTNINQTVSEISTIATNAQGEISAIKQAADSIIAGTSNPEESSSLALLLGYGFQAVTEGKYHKLESTLSKESPIEIYGNRYSQAPTWDENQGKFVFYEEYIDPNGIYYFHSEDETKYCKEVPNGYEIYTIGNTAISAMGETVSEVKSSFDSWTKFQAGSKETMSTISQSSSEGEAEISSVVFGQYRQCIEIRDDLTEDEIAAIPKARYNKQPSYKNGRFVFYDFSSSSEWDYYMIDGDDTHYYKVVRVNNEIIGYEKYAMQTSNYASIMQKVDENGSAIGLVASNNNVEGGIFVQAINERSSVLINADKIGINGTAIFRDNLNNGTTTISGDYIRTGCLMSNNFNGPITYRRDGLSFVQVKNIPINPVCEFTSGVNSYLDPDGDTFVFSPLITSTGTVETYFVGINLGIDAGVYYYMHNGQINTITINIDSLTTLSGVEYTEYTYDTTDSSVPKDIKIKLCKNIQNVDNDLGGEYVLTTSDGCVYYVPVNAGGNYQRIGSVSGQAIGGVSKIDSNEKHQLSILNLTSSGYWVSNEEFDVVDLNSQAGVKFDLNKGAIYSKNFRLTPAGNLTIAGKITATGGYIGDGTNGFTIAKNSTSGRYTLYNGQTSLIGSSSKGTAGVYIAPDGIGLGNGNFYVNNQGVLTTKGSVNLCYSNGKKALELSDDGILFKNKNDETLLTINNDGITFNGSSGSDIDIEGTLEKYGITLEEPLESTTIGSASISSPYITGGVVSGGILEVTGIGDAEHASTSALYIYGPDPDRTSSLELKGYISYDVNQNENENETKYRMFFRTINNTALKLYSTVSMSLETKKGNVYIVANPDEYDRYGEIKFTTQYGADCHDYPGISVNGNQLATQTFVSNELSMYELKGNCLTLNDANAEFVRYEYLEANYMLKASLEDYVTKNALQGELTPYIRSYFNSNIFYADLATDYGSITIRNKQGKSVGGINLDW